MLFCTFVALFAFVSRESLFSPVTLSQKSSITTFQFLKKVKRADISEAGLKNCSEILVNGPKTFRADTWLTHSTYAGWKNWNRWARIRRAMKMISWCCLNMLLYNYDYYYFQPWLLHYVFMSIFLASWKLYEQKQKIYSTAAHKCHNFISFSSSSLDLSSSGIKRLIKKIEYEIWFLKNKQSGKHKCSVQYAVQTFHFLKFAPVKLIEDLDFQRHWYFFRKSLICI